MRIKKSFCIVSMLVFCFACNNENNKPAPVNAEDKKSSAEQHCLPMSCLCDYFLGASFSFFTSPFLSNTTPSITSLISTRWLSL